VHNVKDLSTLKDQVIGKPFHVSCFGRTFNVEFDLDEDDDDYLEMSWTLIVPNLRVGY